MLQRAFRLFYGAILLCGLAFAVSGIALGVQALLTHEWMLWVVQKAGDGAALLFLTLAFGWAFIARRNGVAAPLAYVSSYLLIGVTFLQLPDLFGFKGPNPSVVGILALPTTPMGIAVMFGLAAFAFTNGVRLPPY